MANYNRVIIMGNLTRDPEYKQLPSGQSICKFGLASNRQFKNRQTGAMIQEVCFVDVDVWGPQADSCNQYLQKGKNVLIEGRLKLDTWIDNSGQKKSKHSVVADRVTFLWNAASDQDTNQTQNQSFDNGQNGNTVTNNFSQPVAAVQQPQPVQVQPVQAQAAQPQAVQAATTQTVAEQVKPAGQSPTGEINFKDEKPFEDDLPF